MKDLPFGYVVQGCKIRSWQMGWPINGTVQFSAREYDSRTEAVNAAWAHFKRMTILRERRLRK